MVYAHGVAQYLPLADKIVLLSEDGRISNQGSYEQVKRDASLASLTANFEAPDAEDEVFPEKKNLPAGLLPSTEDVEDLLRKTGDMEVYKYYFQSVGLIPALTFVLFAATTDFGVSFSRKPVHLKTDYFSNAYWSQKFGSNGGQIPMAANCHSLQASTYC